ncbi:MAG: release factor glutamine methyltransferase [Crocinitomicaceae bacterium]|jgi:release factor glutamine methyltransferase
MFVQANSLKEIKRYFNSELSILYTESELKLIIKELTIKRLDISSVDYLLLSEKRLSESDLLFYHDALKRLRNQEPFQYILGEVWFYDLNLKIDSRALIPRPETEELVDWIKTDLKNLSQPTMMDLCSGSGCIALALKSLMPESNCSAAEYSEDALSLLRENAKRTNLSLDISKMDVLNEDDYSYLAPNSFDCWVSNPPYIPTREKSLMAPNVLKHEPLMALFVTDEDPLVFYRVIAEKALVYLKKGGALYFEINENLTASMLALLEGLGFVNIEVRKDLQGKDRMMKAQTVSSHHESE